MQTMRQNDDGYHDDERFAADEASTRREPSSPGFRAVPSIARMKLRGEAGSRAALALILVAATLAVLAVAHLGDIAGSVLSIFGTDLQASEGRN